MTDPISGPFDAGPGFSLGEDPYMDGLGPALAGGDGVFAFPPNVAALSVYGNGSGLKAFVRAGKAVVRGGIFINPGDYEVDFTSNGTGSPRVDRVVLRHDRTANSILPHVILGTPGAGAPDVIRNEGGVWDIKLAQVQIPAGSVTVTPGQVLDEREYLPQRIGQYAGGTSPAVDGSQGNVYYDLATRQLMATDGTTWAPLQRFSDTTKVVTITAVDRWQYSGATNPIVRKINGWVHLWAAIASHTGTTAGTVATLPTGYRPVNDVHGLFDNGSSIANYSIRANGDLTVSGATPGAVFFISETYPAA